MPKTRQQKEVVVKNLSQLFKDSTAVVFADYKGLSVPQADELRDKMHEGNVKYMVAKKTLINLAAKEAGYELNAKSMPGMLGVAFGSDDEVVPAKIFGDISKTSSLTLVGGLYDGQVVSQDYVVSLSKLPGRQQLYGMFVNVINGPTSGFVRALDAIRAKKEEAEGAPAPAPTAETPATETAESGSDEAETAEAPVEARAEAPSPAEEAPAAEPPKE
ncbi:MAG: 50S ribosomal protein L10 [Patescibacteria group bacterium]